MDRSELNASDKTVYSSPQLDLVGWFALGPADGPEHRHLSVHMQIQAIQNLESAILLLFHPEMVAESGKMGGKLPLTLYEGVWTNESTMDIDGPERNQTLKFREAPYSVETGEAEMISLDFVARGGGNATAVRTSSAAQAQTDESKKAKSKAKELTAGSQMWTERSGVKEAPYLSPEDDELLTSLTAKFNAIKMLQSRLNLISSFLRSLPPSYLTDKSISLDPSNKALNQPILRSISALLARLPLLVPPDKNAFDKESLQTKSDVELITLLSSLTRSVNDAKELGKKLIVVENGKMSSRRGGLRTGELGSFHQSEATFNIFPKEDMDAMHGVSSSGWSGNLE
jgi:COP9 signalosome complex subunit 6